MRWREDGIHWRNAANPRLRDLAETNAYEMYPEMMDAEREHDGVLQVAFGSHWAEIKLRSEGHDASSVFLNGHCIALAIALHKRLGYPFAVFTATTEYSFWQGHVGLDLGNGEILDFSGKTTTAQVHRDHRLGNTNDFVTMGWDELVTQYADNPEDPMSYLGELEQLITEDFADHIIKEHNIPANTSLMR